jgi:hypothetical protein
MTTAHLTDAAGREASAACFSHTSEKAAPGPFLIASILPDDTSSATLSQPVAVLPTGKSISAGATSYVKLKG